MQLTQRQQETLNAIKATGLGGIGFQELKAAVNVRGTSTLRQRLGELRKAKKIDSKVEGKFARYFAVGK
jgi:predicted transcriptional regulator